MRVFLNSKAIPEIEYTFTTKSLVVFSDSGTKRIYKQVPDSKIRELLISKTPYEYFNYNIKHKYPESIVHTKKKHLKKILNRAKVIFMAIAILSLFLSVFFILCDWAWENSKQHPNQTHSGRM